MTDDQPMAQREDAWEEFEKDQRTILEQLQDDADDWEILAVDIAGDDEESLFLLVIRRRVNEDQNLILSERYYRYDLEEREGHWLPNGIERRVTGSMAAALRVLYAATTNGDVDPEDPMLMDSREDGLQYHPEELQEPLGDLLEEDEPEETEPEPPQGEPASGKRVSVHKSVDESGGARRTPTCEECGGRIEEKTEAVNLAAGLGKDLWIHNVCPTGDDDE